MGITNEASCSEELVGSGRYCSRESRQRILRWVGRAKESGMTEPDCSCQEVGLVIA